MHITYFLQLPLFSPPPFFFKLQGPVGGVEEVPPFQPQVHTYVCDVGKRESVYSTAEKVRREVGDVDILINNAGVVSGHHLLECPDELIERTMVVNCHAHFWVSRWFVNRCKGERGGSWFWTPMRHLQNKTFCMPTINPPSCVSI